MRRSGIVLRLLLPLHLVGVAALAQQPPQSARPRAPREAPEPALIVTQVPVGLLDAGVGPAGGALRSDAAEGARLVLVTPGQPIKILAPDFAAATDPDVSFDGKRILFAGKKSSKDPWCIFEMNADGTDDRKLTCGPGNARHPIYLSTLHTLAARVTDAWTLFAFVGLPIGQKAEDGLTPAANIYTCGFDGTGLRPISFGLSPETDPVLLPDGRIVTSVWRAHNATLVSHPRTDLVSMNLEGSDPLGYVTHEGGRVKQMSAVVGSHLVFVEAERSRSDGGGTLGTVKLVRNRHTYRALTATGDGLFRAPSAAGPEALLAGWRPAEGRGTWGICRYDLPTGTRKAVFDDPAWDDVAAMSLAPRPRPDDRSSPVRLDDPSGKFYGIDVGLSDLSRADWPKGLARRLRVLEGVPRTGADANALATRRLLGEVPLAADGSFHVSAPANTPVELQLLDEDGLALRSCAWIATRNHFNQGCIGCHEDPERTPPNRFVQAIQAPAANLTPPPDARRTMDYVHDVRALVKAQCLSCHGNTGDMALEARPGETEAETNLRTYRLLVPEYVTPGAARTSRLTWHLMGRNTARPWDGAVGSQTARPMPPGGNLSDGDRRTIVEWIDFGAAFDAKSALSSPSPAGEAR